LGKLANKSLAIWLMIFDQPLSHPNRGDKTGEQKIALSTAGTSEWDKIALFFEPNLPELAICH